MNVVWLAIGFALGFAASTLIVWLTADRRRRKAERTFRDRLATIQADPDARIKALQSEAAAKFDEIEARVLAEAELRLDAAVSSALVRFAAQTGLAGPPKNDA